MGIRAQPADQTEDGPGPVHVKIATFNINNVKQAPEEPARLAGSGATPLVCPQEPRAAQHAFPAEASKGAGYHAAWPGQPTCTGVAILARGIAPLVTRRSLPADPMDTQSTPHCRGVRREGSSGAAAQAAACLATATAVVDPLP